MGFSDQLKQELDLKRKNAKSALAAKRKRLGQTPIQDKVVLSSLCERTSPVKEAAALEIADSEMERIKETKGSEVVETRETENVGKKVAEEIEFKETRGIENGEISEIETPQKTLVQSLTEEARKVAKAEAYDNYKARESAVNVIIESQDILDLKTEMLALQIRKFLREMLRTWSDNCDDDYPPAVLLETKRDLVKLMYKLRSKKLDLEVIVSLATIVHYIQIEKLTKASEAYLKLSIGNVAWPIGVRDVGIHARAADAKIAGDDKLKLANIMKSESTRRWLVAVKRLINYSRKLYKR